MSMEATCFSARPNPPEPGTWAMIGSAIPVLVLRGALANAGGP